MGSSRGILVLWNRAMFRKTDQWIGVFSASIMLEEVSSNSHWIVTSVYGPNHSGLQSQFWSELNAVHNRWSGSWCIEGDWNVVRFPSKRSGGSMRTSDMTDFSDWINLDALVDLQLGGAKFT